MFDIDKAISNANYDLLMAKKDSREREINYFNGHLDALIYVKYMLEEEMI